MGELNRALGPVLFGLLFLLSGVFGHSQYAQALIIVLSDFDDTIVESREAYRGTFQTKYRLWRVRARANVLQREPDGPLYVDVPAAIYERVEKYLAQGERLPGTIGRKQTLPDGTQFHPGDYYLRDSDSYLFFEEGLDGTNHLLETFKEAEAADPEGGWKGKFWDAMVRVLSTEESARGFGIVTARGHSIEEWREFFEYLRSKNYIQFLPNFELFLNVTRPEAEKYSIEGKIAAAKLEYLEHVVRTLGRNTDRVATLSPDGEGEVEYHTLVFADDHQVTVEGASDLFRRLAMSRRYRTKLVLVNTGTGSEVKDSERPRALVYREDGTFRPATGEEELAKDCEASLAEPEGGAKS